MLRAEDEHARGKAIYQTKCAKCHGDQGGGVADVYDETLYGDRPLAELIGIISETMPEKKPQECVGDDARAVAEYMYDSFYTAIARAKHSPARVEMTRMTVPQYLNSVADLMEPFLGRTQAGEPGLKADYYRARNMSNDKRAFDRIDGGVNFDFGEGHPFDQQVKQKEKDGKKPEDEPKYTAEEFSIRWSGSIIAEETGEYEFAIVSENGFRAWINSPDPIIDGWVASGREKSEKTAAITLIGGRMYPVKIEYFKYKGKSASIEFKWRPPGGVWSTVPTQNLTSRYNPATLVLETAFPPDDSSIGYERGISASKAWDSATTYAAIEAANRITHDIDRIAKGDKNKSKHIRYRDFAERFVTRAFRRPLTEEQLQRYVNSHFAKEKDPVVAMKRVIVLALKSPRFLYPELNDGKTDQYDIANRLSFALWDSIPDEQLLKAAENNQLAKPWQVRQHAERMLKDPRARLKMQGFFHHLLEYDEAEDVDKDTEVFPDFDEYVIDDLKRSLDLFIDDVVWGESSDFRELLLSDELYLNDRLAAFYGVEKSGDEEFSRVKFDAKERAGIVTHPFLMTTLSYHKSSSPIHRGVFVTRRLLSRALKPPPMAIEFMDSKFEPSLTMREKVAELTKSKNCMSCHSVINPLGFSLENYDAVGRYRTVDRDKPVDASGEYMDQDGAIVKLTGARDVAEYAAQSKLSQQGFVEQLFHHMVKQSARAYGDDRLVKLRDQFEKDDYHIRKLMVEIAIVAAEHDMPSESKKK